MSNQELKVFSVLSYNHKGKPTWYQHENIRYARVVDGVLELWGTGYDGEDTLKVAYSPINGWTRMVGRRIA